MDPPHQDDQDDDEQDDSDDDDDQQPGGAGLIHLNFLQKRGNKLLPILNKVNNVILHLCSHDLLRPGRHVHDLELLPELGSPLSSGAVGDLDGDSQVLETIRQSSINQLIEQINQGFT